MRRRRTWRQHRARLFVDRRLAPKAASRTAAGADRVAFDGMKRLRVGVGSTYLLFAVLGRFVEGMGAVEYGCAADCWCKRPVLSVFRWVFPYGHRDDEACGSPIASPA